MLSIQPISDDTPDKTAFFNELYQKYCPIMRHQVYKLTGDMSQADDLVQDAILRLIGRYNILRTLNEPQLIFYIVKTVRSVTINTLHKESSQEKWACEWEDMIADADTPEQTYLRSENRKELSDAVSQLPQAAQDLLYFRYMLDISNEALAKQYGTSQENIRQRLSRARRALFHLMGGASHDRP